MSLEALENAIAQLDEAQLGRLQEYIRSLRQRRSPEWRAEMARQLDDTTSGRWLTLEAAETELDRRRTAPRG